MSGMPFKRDWALSHTRAQRLVLAQLNFGLTEEERYAELYNRATVLDEIFGSDDPEAEVERVLNQLAVIAAGALVDTVIDGDAEYDEDNPPVPSAADAIAALSAKLQAELMANLDKIAQHDDEGRS